MRRCSLSLIGLLVAGLWLTGAPAKKEATPWAMYGGTPHRNMVNHEATGLPSTWDEVKKTNIKWVAKLGSRAHGQPLVAGERILIGTNNQNPRNKRDRGPATDDEPEGPPIDRGILMCFRASDGKFLWQAVHEMLESGQVNDWPCVGIPSTPVVGDNRVYYVSNRCEVVCLDLDGFANGNDGFQREKFHDDTDADVIWSFDMIKELDVFPHNKAVCSPLIVGDLLFVTTGNGVGDDHVMLPSPDAPSFICLDRLTGRLVWKSNLPGGRVMHAQWSSPTYGVIGGVPQVIFPGGDGWVYSFEPTTGKLIWRFDANPKDAKYELGGKGSRSDFIGSAVIYKARVFIGTGQDPEHYEGVGHFWCIDPTGKGDISPELMVDDTKDPPVTKRNPNSGAIWHFGGEDLRPFAQRDNVFGRTMSTACIVDDVVYIPEVAGYFHCLDARSGKKYWTIDTKCSIWASAYFADGKVYLPTEDGDVFVFRHDPKPVIIEDAGEAFLRATMKARATKASEAEVKTAGSTAAANAHRKLAAKVLIAKIECDQAVRSTPNASGKVLYIASESKLFAIAEK